MQVDAMTVSAQAGRKVVIGACVPRPMSRHGFLGPMLQAKTEGSVLQVGRRKFACLTPIQR